MLFKDLGLSDEILRAITDAGYETPTPIQEQAVPYVLMNRDLLGCAQTGTGKTASFVLPMLDILSHGRARARMPRSLILEPTRELAAQVAENFKTYGKYQKLSMALLIGGVSFDDQEKALDRGVDVLVATPGRLIDHYERGRILMSDVKILVIDEADRMLDMGFIPDVERIVKLLPRLRQTLMFSATMPREIRGLAEKFLMNPKEISVSPPSTTAETVAQALVIVDARDKREALRKLLNDEQPSNALIFCNRKRDVGILHRSLSRHGFEVGALHGDMDQFSRTATLESFKKGEIKYLVCSDVAARGLDIVGMSHVFNFDVPINSEDYVHRIGRTGRAGKSGRAISLATEDDARYVAAIQKMMGKPIPRIELDGLTRANVEITEESGRKRRRRPSRRGAEKEERQSSPAAPHPAPPAQERSKPAQERRPPRPQAARPEPRQPRPEAKTQPKTQPKAEPAKPSRGFGDDTPAFLLRPVKVT
ncbi:MAG: DEAD/DEAH box helicase [Alphaproteobacteria bacterium]|nr:DEAD/DEAH box helicase [Alphaproteobacteria bacterium]